ncbi:MAG TPA: DUF937 domain-containing protein, partial [Chloroflexota bacterium]|nr:DUF937 domain-containing protein [Chloroflexota bacterium]
FDALRQIMTPEMLSQLGRKVGMDEATVSRAGDVALPLIAAGMARMASTPEGSTALYDEVNRADPNVLGHLTSFIGRFDVASGAAKVRALLGPEAGAMMVSVERATGTDLAPLVAMLTPIVTGFLNNQVRTRHLDPVGLARLLQEGAQQELQSGRPAAATVGEAIAAADSQRAHRARYQPDEWRTMQRAPLAAGVIVMAADEGGGLQREQQAIASTVRQAVLQAPAGALLAAIYTDGLDPADEEQVLSTLRMHDVPEVRQGFLRTCQDAVALAGRTSAQDGAAYRALLLQVSQAVAQAAKEGGFLGLGGVQVSGKEQDALDELTRALGGAPPAGPLTGSGAQESPPGTPQGT